MELGFDEITSDFYHWLKQFNPVGPGNMKPVFSTQGVVDAGSRLVGRNQEHLKLEVRDGKSSVTMSGIAFGMHEHYAYIKSGAPHRYMLYDRGEQLQGHHIDAVAGEGYTTFGEEIILCLYTKRDGKFFPSRFLLSLLSIVRMPIRL